MIPRHLIGLALGEKGSNKMRAQTLKGVKSIQFNQKNSTFTITGYVRIFQQELHIINRSTKVELK
jgi:hypothetical protein